MNVLIKKRMAVALLAVAGCVLAACGGTSDNASTGPVDNAAIKASVELIDSHAAGKGGEPPASAPEPATSKNVWYVSCGSVLDACKRAGEQVEDAGALLGWNVTVFDGKLNPSAWNQGIQQAIVEGADAIITSAIDCPAVSQVLTAANAKGIKTVSLLGFDCDDAAFGEDGKPLYTHSTQTSKSGTMVDTATLMGKLEAAWLIRDSDGKASVIQFAEDDQAIVGYIGNGFAEQMKTCDSCRIVETVPFSIADLGPNLVQKARTALLKHPDAQYLVAPNDSSAALLNQAVTQAGKANKVKVIGTLGDAQNVSIIKSGGPQVMSVGIDTGWLGWAAMDDLVRLFADKKPVYSGWSVGIVDKDTLPDGSTYHGPVSYENLYANAWGKS